MGLRAVALIIAASVAGCAAREGTFARYPGFAEYFAEHPRDGAPAGPDERALLERYRPRIVLPPDHPGPIDFYADYVAQGTLYDGRGRTVSDRVTPETLNAYREDPGAVFVHRPRPLRTTATVYGRVDRDTVVFPTPAGPVEEPFSFLTYNIVFRTSGLPAGVPWWQRALLGAIGSASDWHQLDHYTAATLALSRDLLPIALTLQQHNYMHTYLIGRDLPLPPDGRVAIDVAIGSNELYPHRPGRVRRRAVSFMDGSALRYLITGKDRPFLAADDLTDGAREADYRLAFLPPADAFYCFQGRLGEPRRLPGRDGPPGADYNTLPALKAKGVQMLAFYWREGNLGDLARAETVFTMGGNPSALAALQAGPFYEDWQCEREPGAGCGARAADARRGAR